MKFAGLKSLKTAHEESIWTAAWVLPIDTRPALLLIESLDETMKLRRPDELELERTNSGYCLSVVSVSAHPSGVIAASTSLDSFIRVFDVDTNATIATLEVPPLEVWQLEFDPKKVDATALCGFSLSLSCERLKAEMEDSAGGGATKKETEENIPNGYRVIYVLGRPGSGKTTQCSNISSQLGFCHLIIGNLLQEEAESGSKDGKMIQDLKKEGKLVPSEIVVQLLQKAMEKSKSKTFLMDGFPRSEENLAAAESIMKIEPDLVLLFDCSEEECARRLLNRNQGREDDNVETIKKRLRVYAESTAPVVNHYSSRGKIQKIDAERPIEEVYESVKRVFSELKNE